MTSQRLNPRNTADQDQTSNVMETQLRTFNQIDEKTSVAATMKLPNLIREDNSEFDRESFHFQTMNDRGRQSNTELMVAEPLPLKRQFSEKSRNFTSQKERDYETMRTSYEHPWIEIKQKYDIKIEENEK